MYIIFGGDGVMVKKVFYTWSGNNESHTYYFGSNGKDAERLAQTGRKEILF